MITKPAYPPITKVTGGKIVFANGPMEDASASPRMSATAAVTNGMQ